MDSQEKPLMIFNGLGCLMLFNDKTTLKYPGFASVSKTIPLKQIQEVNLKKCNIFTGGCIKLTFNSNKEIFELMFTAKWQNEPALKICEEIERLRAELV